MNILVNTIGGGTFSKFMIAVQSIFNKVGDVDSVESIYVDIDRDRIDPERQWELHINPFDFVLEQRPLAHYDLVIPATYAPVYPDVLHTPDIGKLRKICKKIKIKKLVWDKIHPEVGKDTLGVHVRITDMNALHSGYGTAQTAEYISKITEILSESKYDNIFVASDNQYSLGKIGESFNIIYNNVGNRAAQEGDASYVHYLRSNSGKEALWVDSCAEMLSLSMCSGLVYKISSLNVASVCYSSSLKESYRL